MLNAIHKFDPQFNQASSFLKKTIQEYVKSDWEACLDIPCGNGRNTFLLADYFELVTAIDVQPNYLSSIESVQERYGNPKIDTLCLDILVEPIIDLSRYQFICNIHFFDSKLITSILKGMAKGAYFLIETPSCNGGNFIDLPTEMELQAIINSQQLVNYNFRPCLHKRNTEKRGAFKALIKKEYD